MDQEITLSPDVIDYINNNTPAYRKNEALDLIELIEQNYITNDINNNQLQSYFETLNKIQDPQKRNAISEIIKKWQEKINEIPYKIEKEKYEEIDLSKLSKDKLLLYPNKTEKDINKLRKKINDVEFYNVSSFIKPQAYQRLKNLPTKIIFEKDVQYDLTIIVEPFFRHSKKIEFYDPYIYNPNAFNQLKKIINIIASDKKIELIALNEHNYCKNDNNGVKKINYDNFNNYIKTKIDCGYNIIINDFKSKKHKERYISTDKYLIYLPGGLDLLDVDNYPTLDEENEVKEIRIDCKY